MKKLELIFLPAPGSGHRVSAIEFSKRLIAHNSRLSVTILLVDSFFSPKSQSDPVHEYDEYDSSTRIRYINLPRADSPSPELLKESIVHASFVHFASYKPHVRDVITRLQESGSTNEPVHVLGLFVDMFFTSMIDIADELSIPCFVFFCSSAAFLGFILHLSDHSEQTGATQFNESDPDTIIPSFLNPVPSRVLPSFVFNTLGYEAFKDHAKRFKEAKGIIVNTCTELEPYAVKSFSNAYKTSPVYPVGPVLSLDNHVHKACDAGDRERIIGWLNNQPESSVVFLCFGSAGSLSEDQIREIAKGIKQSGQRFVWSLRKPQPDDMLKPTEYMQSELKGILGDEFWLLLEEEHGLVCGWAPQVEILAHESVGAFVSHCGWNSILESLWFRKPIVTWPLYAEQQMNAFQVVRELGVAVELTLDYGIGSSNLVEAGEVEKAIRSVMDEDNPVRYRVEKMSEVCRETLMEGGSSYSCVDKLLRTLVGEIESNAC